MKIRSRWILAGLASVLVAGQAMSQPAAAERTISAFVPYVFSERIQLEENQEYTATTLNETTGTSAVIDVFEYAPGGLARRIATNDICCSGLAPEATIPAGPRREAWIIVHASDATGQGSADVIVRPSTIPPPGQPPVPTFTFTSVPVNEGIVRTGLGSPARVTTVEEQDGLDDTFIIEFSAISGAFLSDEGGAAKMAALTMYNDATLTPLQRVLIGAKASTGGTTTIIIDPAQSGDADSDGLSSDLENIIGTSDSSDDTDSDGISDGDELYGVAEPKGLLRLPYYGANPAIPDVFIEADWEECTSAACANIDSNQLTTAAAHTTSSYLSPLIQVHIDMGQYNSDPSTRTTWGDWGGANRSTPGQSCANLLTPERKGYFHHATMVTNGGEGVESGTCFVAQPIYNSFIHELGHNLGLAHGSLTGYPANCNPLYQSLMNYQTHSVFLSSNEHIPANGFPILNPTNLSETGNSSQLAALLKDYGFNSPNAGEIDWNRDGEISKTPVRASIHWAPAFSTSPICETTGSEHASFIDDTGNGSAMAWHAPDGQSSASLFVISRSIATSSLTLRRALAFPTGCKSLNDHPGCRVTWDPVQTDPPTDLGPTTNGFFAPAATRLSSGATSDKLYVAFADSIKELNFSVLTSTSTWSPVKPIGPAPLEVFDAPAAATYGSEVWVLAPVIKSGVGRLVAVTDNGTGSWVVHKDQVWEDGTPIVPSMAVGLTSGFVRISGVTIETMVAAIPGTAGVIDIAWYDKKSDTWHRLDAAAYQFGRQITVVQPGIAYEPFDSLDPTAGRFYLTFTNNKQQTLYYRHTSMDLSEGNDLSGSALSRRFVFREEPVALGDPRTFSSSSNVPIHFDIDFDLNLRMVESSVARTPESPVGYNLFYPFADNIMDVDFTDQDDVPVMRSNLSCSLQENCP